MLYSTVVIMTVAAYLSYFGRNCYYFFFAWQYWISVRSTDDKCRINL